jgi:hypothetical protein
MKMSERVLTAGEKLRMGLPETPKPAGTGGASIFMRNGPGALNNTSGMNMDQINALVKQWNEMPDSDKVGMILTA